MDMRSGLSIWFFIGISLLVNGALILGAGLYELVYPPQYKVELYSLHASIWWGALLLIAGAIYCYHFRPGRPSAVKPEVKTRESEGAHAR